MRQSLQTHPSTDVELAEAAKIKTNDVEHARAQWKKDAPAEVKNLLDAELHEEST